MSNTTQAPQDNGKIVRMCTITFVLFQQRLCITARGSHLKRKRLDSELSIASPCVQTPLGQHQLGECEGKLVSTRVREAATERGTGRGGHKAEIALASSR